MVMPTRRRYQISLASLFFLLSVSAIGAALLGASAALGIAFLMLAVIASLRTIRVGRYRRLAGSEITFSTSTCDFVFSFAILVGVIVLSLVTVVFTLAIGAIHVAKLCWKAFYSLMNFLRLPSLLAHFFRLLNKAWYQLVSVDKRMISRLRY